MRSINMKNKNYLPHRMSSVRNKFETRGEGSTFRPENTSEYDGVGAEVAGTKLKLISERKFTSLKASKFELNNENCKP